MKVEQLEGLAAMDAPWREPNAAERAEDALISIDPQSCPRSICGPSSAHPEFASECLVPIDGSMWTHKQASRYTSVTP